MFCFVLFSFCSGPLPSHHNKSCCWANGHFEHKYPILAWQHCPVCQALSCQPAKEPVCLLFCQFWVNNPADTYPSVALTYYECVIVKLMVPCVCFLRTVRRPTILPYAWRNSSPNMKTSLCLTSGYPAQMQHIHPVVHLFYRLQSILLLH